MSLHPQRQSRRMGVGSHRCVKWLCSCHLPALHLGFCHPLGTGLTRALRIWSPPRLLGRQPGRVLLQGMVTTPSPCPPRRKSQHCRHALSPSPYGWEGQAGGSPRCQDFSSRSGQGCDLTRVGLFRELCKAWIQDPRSRFHRQLHGPDCILSLAQCLPGEEPEQWWGRQAGGERGGLRCRRKQRDF